MNDNKNIKTKPIELPLRVGAKYQTRDGQVFEIERIDPHNKSSHAVRSEPSGARWRRTYWCLDGSYYSDQISSNLDLVAEVVEEEASASIDPVLALLTRLCERRAARRVYSGIEAGFSSVFLDVSPADSDGVVRGVLRFEVRANDLARIERGGSILPDSWPTL